MAYFRAVSISFGSATYDVPRASLEECHERAREAFGSAYTVEQIPDEVALQHPDLANSKRRVGTIDLTPTWRATVPVIVAAIENGTPEGRRLAVEELYRMADHCDGRAAG